MYVRSDGTQSNPVQSVTPNALTCDPRVESRAQRYVNDRNGSFHIHQLVFNSGSAMWEQRRLFVTPAQIAVHCFATATAPATSIIHPLTPQSSICISLGDDKRSVLTIEPGVVLHLSSENPLKRDVLVMVLRHWMYIPHPLVPLCCPSFPPPFSPNSDPLAHFCSTVLKSPPVCAPVHPLTDPSECSTTVVSSSEGSAVNHSDSLDAIEALPLSSDAPAALSPCSLAVTSVADAAATNVSLDAAGALLPSAEVESTGALCISSTAVDRPCPAPQASQVLADACFLTCIMALCLST